MPIRTECPQCKAVHLASGRVVNCHCGWKDDGPQHTANMHPIIEEILMHGFSIDMSYNSKEKRIEHKLDGFYKSGQVILYESDGRLYCTARYDNKEEVTSFSDLVLINYDWWCRSKERFDGWATPDPKWLPFLLEKNLVKAETKVTYHEAK